MQILVTGGAGFIGSNLVAQLVIDGHSVRVLDNLLSGFRINLSHLSEIEFIEGDVRDDAALVKAVQGAEVVFHLAAAVGNKRSIERPIEDSEINVLGTLKLLEASTRAGVRKVVASSSAGIFGELKTLPIREDHPTDPDSPYGVSKLAAEKLCRVYDKLGNLETVCLRYFNVYGPNQRFDAYGNVIPIFVFRTLRSESLTVFGDGEQTRDFVNVRDVVQANIAAAMTAGVSGAFNVGSGTRITINQLLSHLTEGTGLYPSVTYGAHRAGDVRDSLADITAARTAFGYSPAIRIDAGLKDYVSWARGEHQRLGAAHK